MDSTPWIPGSRYWIPVLVRGTWILDPVSIGRILDSLSYIPHSTARDSGFHEQNFPAFRNPESRFPHRGQFKTSPNFKTVDVRMNRIPPETKMYVLLPYPLAPGSFAFSAKSKCQFFPKMPTDRLFSPSPPPRPFVLMVNKSPAVSVRFQFIFFTRLTIPY